MNTTYIYTVCVYDDSCDPLQDPPIDIFLFKDRTAALLARGQTEDMGQDGWGAVLSFELEEPAPITVIVDDDTSQFAGGAYHHLNGGISSRLDLILYPLPGAGGGPNADDDSPSGPLSGIARAEGHKRIDTYLSAAAFINGHPLWNPDEKRGVRSLFESYLSACSTSISDVEIAAPLAKIALRWEGLLVGLGIEAAAIARRAPITAAASVAHAAVVRSRVHS